MDEQVNVSAGAESAPAAGEQEQSDSFDLESLLFGEDEKGAEVEGAADPVEEPEQQTDELPEDASKAFAKKWAAESDKLKEKVRAEVMAEVEQRTRTTPQEQAQGAPTHRSLSEQDLEKLADDLGLSPQATKIFYEQQQAINRLTEETRRNQHRSREQSLYNEAVQYAKKLSAENPSLPNWDDTAVHQYRIDHYKQYGTTLPWKEAYRMQLADAVVNGNLTRQAQQDAIRKIQQRDTASAPVKAPSAKKMSIDDLSSDQFKRMVEDAKVGKFSKK